MNIKQGTLYLGQWNFLPLWFSDQSNVSIWFPLRKCSIYWWAIISCQCAAVMLKKFAVHNRIMYFVADKANYIKILKIPQCKKISSAANTVQETAFVLQNVCHWNTGTAFVQVQLETRCPRAKLLTWRAVSSDKQAWAKPWSNQHIG